MSLTEFDPADHLTVGAVGPPGQRAFMLQGQFGADLLTLLCEKEQVVALSQEAFQLLAASGFPQSEEAGESELPDLNEMNEASWRIGEISIAYVEPRDMVMIECRELVIAEEDEGGSPLEELEEELDPAVARFWVSRPQLMALAKRGIDVASQGRPICPYCWRPMDEDHFCIATNGHARRDWGQQDADDD